MTSGEPPARLRVLVVTKIFPNAREPLSAPFNRQQLAALGRHCDVHVLATIPWFPGASVLGRWSTAGRLVGLPRADQIDGLSVQHPRTLYLPRFGHAASAAFYAACVAPYVLARRNRFDVLLGTWAYPDAVAAVAIGKAMDVPTVVKLHGSDIDVLATRPLLREQIGFALSRADRVVAVSGALAKAAQGLGAVSEKIDVVTNGVDQQLFQPRDRGEARALLGHGADQRRWILYVGRLNADKGVMDLAAAFRRLAARRDDVVLVVVGDGPARPALDEALRPLTNQVISSGAKALTEIPTWMAACDVLTLPSHHEGTPNVLLEALACGRRVVATRVGGIPDVVTHETLGTLVPVEDSEALALALDEATAASYDPAAVASLGTRGGWDESAKRLLESLKRAYSEHASRRPPGKSIEHGL